MNFAIWRNFLDGVPIYLARSYWWAHLWRPAIHLFDCQPVINAILFGKYKQLLVQTLACLKQCPPGRVLQLTCVYGKLTPTLMRDLEKEPLYLVDVALQQIMHSQSKLEGGAHDRLLPVRMNAENMALSENSFSTVLVFFLFHEMPVTARQRAYGETVRVLRPGGQLVIVEYGSLPHTHWVYRFRPSRWMITRLEPFLDDFWREDLQTLLQAQALKQGKVLNQTKEYKYFDGFYRIVSFSVTRSFVPV